MCALGSRAWINSLQNKHSQCIFLDSFVMFIASAFFILFWVYEWVSFTAVRFFMSFSRSIWEIGVFWGPDHLCLGHRIPWFALCLRLSAYVQCLGTWVSSSFPSPLKMCTVRKRIPTLQHSLPFLWIFGWNSAVWDDFHYKSSVCWWQSWGPLLQGHLFWRATLPFTHFGALAVCNAQQPFTLFLLGRLPGARGAWGEGMAGCRDYHWAHGRIAQLWRPSLGTRSCSAAMLR